MSEIKEKVMEAKVKAGNWCKEKYWDAKQYWEWHKDDLIAAASFGSAVAAGGVKVYNLITKERNRRQNLSYADRKMFYDPSTGTRWQLKRNLNNRENRRLEELKASGMTTGEALRKMKILKR